MVQGSNPGRGNSLSSKHETNSEVHPPSYSMGIRCNYLKVLAEGLAAAWCWPLNVSSSEVKNKCSHSTTPPKWPSFHGPDRFVVNCGRILWLSYPSSKPLPSKLTQSNPDFTFLRGSFKINLKLREWKYIFKTYFCRVSDAAWRHHIWSKAWWCVPLPCIQLWTNTTQHKEIFGILQHVTVSLFRTCHRLLHMEAQMHSTHSCSLFININQLDALNFIISLF